MSEVTPSPVLLDDPASDEWLESMRRAFRTEESLRDHLGLRPREDAADDVSSFPVFVSREYASRMLPGDDRDPLLLQVLPDARENVVTPGFVSDAVGDREASVAPGLLHKYYGRALVVTTGACGVHCRYCFRREYPYVQTSGRSENYASTIDYLRQHSEIDEVLLSGGDPLTLTDNALARLLDQIESVEHVQRIRIHSRMPIVIPSRVTESLIKRLQRSRLTCFMVIHANHAREIDDETELAIARMVDGGIPVLNQSVLLRDVNDSADALESLSRRLLDCRAIPYYLHQLDRVQGTAHFEVEPARGRELIAQLESRLPGLGVPRYVTEIPGETSKTRL